MADNGDLLEELIDERAASKPAFPGMVEAAYERRRLLRALATRRDELGLSQTQVAARMGTSQSSVARLESGGADARLSTIERFSVALGLRLTWSLDDAPSAPQR